MRKFFTPFWIVVFLLGWLFDFLFWKHTPGISFALYTVAIWLVGFVFLRLDEVRPNRKTLVLLPFILFFALITFLRREPLTALLAYGFTLFLLAGLVVTWRGGRWMEYSLADYFARALDLFASAITRAAAFSAEMWRLQRDAGEGEKRPGAFWPVMRGILLAIPVVAFFAALLSSADQVFAGHLQNLIALFRLENLPEYIFRGFYIALIAYVLAGVYLHAASRSGDENLLGADKPLLPRFFGFIEAVIVLGSVVVLFASFVFVQFQYFFGGLVNIRLDGFTYADYARRGFGELVAVAFFALLLFLSLSALTRRESGAQQKAFSALGVLMVALVGVMLVSAYQRLALYETAYGFTRLRTYTHVFMLWLAALLAAVAVLDVFQRQRIFAVVALAASAGFALSLALMNVDGFIFQQNLQRFEQGETLDVGYLASLSPDAVPAMVNFYQVSPVSADTRDRVGAALACMQAAASRRQSDPAWQAFHLSDFFAAQAQTRLGRALEAYSVSSGSVTTPLGAHYECYSYGVD